MCIFWVVFFTVVLVWEGCKVEILCQKLGTSFKSWPGLPAGVQVMAGCLKPRIHQRPAKLSQNMMLHLH